MELQLFLKGGVVKRLSYLIFKWLGLVVVLPNDVPTMFSIFYSGVSLRKCRKGSYIDLTFCSSGDLKK